MFVVPAAPPLFPPPTQVEANIRAWLARPLRRLRELAGESSGALAPVRAPALSPQTRARLSAARGAGPRRTATGGGAGGPRGGGPLEDGAGGVPGPEEAQRLCALARVAVEGISDLEPLAVRRLVEPTPRGLQHRRQIAMYVAHVGFGVRAADVARCFGRDTTTAYHAFRQVEDMRDDGGVDAFLDAVEGIVTNARALATGGTGIGRAAATGEDEGGRAA